jgi:hypothetical protein
MTTATPSKRRPTSPTVAFASVCAQEHVKGRKKLLRLTVDPFRG